MSPSILLRPVNGFLREALPKNVTKGLLKSVIKTETQFFSLACTLYLYPFDLSCIKQLSMTNR